MAVYEGITKERMGSAHGNCKMKKGRIGNEDTDRGRVEITFCSLASRVHFRSSFLVLVKSCPGVLVLSVAMPVNTGSNQCRIQILRYEGGEGRGWSPKITFQPFTPQFGLKIRGEPGPPGHSPGSVTGNLDPVVYSIFHICFRFLPRASKKRSR